MPVSSFSLSKYKHYIWVPLNRHLICKCGQSHVHVFGFLMSKIQLFLNEPFLQLSFSKIFLARERSFQIWNWHYVFTIQKVFYFKRSRKICYDPFKLKISIFFFMFHPLSLNIGQTNFMNWLISIQLLILSYEEQHLSLLSVSTTWSFNYVFA